MTEASTLQRESPISSEPERTDAPRRRARRRTWLIGFALCLGVIALSWWVWAEFFAPPTVSTDDAYTNVEIAEITPLTSGPVNKINVVNTQSVKAGQVLFTLDDTDQRLALRLARSNLYAVAAAARSALVRTKANLEKAALDLRRRHRLARSGSISAEELTDAQAAFDDATAAYTLARAKVEGANAAKAIASGAAAVRMPHIRNSAVAQNPDVQAALSRFMQARVDLSRTIIRSPISGVVDQRKLAVGERVQSGVPVMMVVPLDSMYVDANFKENQLGHVRPGQPAVLTSDLYGSSVVYHGRVAGFAGGSGAAFAAIPAQNATGNWIKIVRRLPVRIRLDAAELDRHPLRVGLSMTATIDIAKR